MQKKCATSLHKRKKKHLYGWALIYLGKQKSNLFSPGAKVTRKLWFNSRRKFWTKISQLFQLFNWLKIFTSPNWIKKNWIFWYWYWFSLFTRDLKGFILIWLTSLIISYIFLKEAENDVLKGPTPYCKAQYNQVNAVQLYMKRKSPGPIQLFKSWIEHLYPVDSVIVFPYTYPLDTDLSGG